MLVKHRFREHKNSVACCHVLSGGQLVASGDEDGQLCIHDIETSSLTCSSNLQKHSDGGGITSICSSAASSDVLYASAGPDVHILDLRTGIAPVQSYAGFCKDEISQVAVNCKATHVATADDAGDVKVMDLAAGKLFKAMKNAHEPLATSVSFRSHRPWEMITGGMDATVARWDFSRGKCLDRWRMSLPSAAVQENQMLNPPFVHAIAVPQVAGSCRPWCQLVGVARGDGAVLLFDGDAGMPANLYSHGAASVVSACVSHQSEPPNGSVAGKARPKGTVMTGHDRRKGTSKSSKQDQTVVAPGGSKAGLLQETRAWVGPHLWRREDGGHSRPASCVAFSWAGCGDNTIDQSTTPPQLLVSGSEDRRILAWRMQNQPAEQATQTELDDMDSTPDCSMSDASASQATQDSLGVSLLQSDVRHTAKVNCIAAGQGLSRQLLFVGDTKNRLCVYEVQCSGTV